MRFSVLDDKKAKERIVKRIEESKASQYVVRQTRGFCTLPTMQKSSNDESLFFMPTSETLRALRGDMPSNNY